MDFQALGQALGITPTWVGRILNGVNKPSPELAERMARVLGWSANQVKALYRGPLPLVGNDEASKGRQMRPGAQNARETAK